MVERFVDIEEVISSILITPTNLQEKTTYGLQEVIKKFISNLKYNKNYEKIKLASDTIDNNDYKVLIKFLQNKSYLNQSKVTKIFENKFSNLIKKNILFL